MPRKSEINRVPIVRYIQIGMTQKDLENLQVLEDYYQIHNTTDLLRFILNKDASEIMRSRNIPEEE